MIALVRKELLEYFGSALGYLVIATFIVINGLWLWVFKSPYNIIDAGFADLQNFFTIAPWILMFLTSAVTMRSFSEEKKQGNLTLLFTKPISIAKIVYGKYISALCLIIFSLILTLIFVYSIYNLTDPMGNIDLGTTLCSYLGLIFLASGFSAIGIFASSLSNNQVIAFLYSAFFCLLFYVGFDELTKNLKANFLEHLSLQFRFNSLRRGIVDTRDLIYFLSFIVIFLSMTTAKIENIYTVKKQTRKYGGLIVLLILINFLSNTFFKRIDFTADQRYSISSWSKRIVEKIESPMVIDVFLEGNEFPSEIRMLRNEIRYLLEEYNKLNPKINFKFINPIKDEHTAEKNLKTLTRRGLIPMSLQARKNGKISTEMIIPWALASYFKPGENEEVTVKIPLIKNRIGADVLEMTVNSVQNLEYVFSDAFSKLVVPKRQKIAVLQGNGQLKTNAIADFLKSVRDYYYIAPFTLDSVAVNPQKTLDDLKEFDLILIAKPTEAFSEAEKLVLDQYLINGGSSLWLLDRVTVEVDNLKNEQGRTIAIPRDLNLTDMFFKYGIRINPELVKDMYSAPITLAIGNGSNTSFQPVQWQYAPLAKAKQLHPIVHNLEMVKFEFANSIDTLKNKLSKIPLLKSSSLSKLEKTPCIIDLETVTKEPNREDFNSGPQLLAVLLEGLFTSAFNNKVLPFKVKNFKSKSDTTNIIVISDGDLIKNKISATGHEELGFDPWTGQLFGNKEFLINCVNYLLNNKELLNLRTKNVSLAILDYQKIKQKKTKWQIINILTPLLILILIGLLFQYLRRNLNKG